MTDDDVTIPAPHSMHDFRMIAGFILRNLGFVMRGEDRDQLMQRLDAEGYDIEQAAAYASVVEIIRDMTETDRLSRRPQ